MIEFEDQEQMEEKVAAVKTKIMSVLEEEDELCPAVMLNTSVNLLMSSIEVSYKYIEKGKEEMMHHKMMEVIANIYGTAAAQYGLEVEKRKKGFIDKQTAIGFIRDEFERLMEGLG